LSKFTPLSDELYGYLAAHRTPDDELLRELARETRERFGRRAGMQVSPDQGTLLGLLARLIGARRALEIGTFTGYSAICIARALPADGRLIACDVSDEYTTVARRYFEQAGVADRIELRLGPGLETLDALPAEPSFDFAFVDADKTSYSAYFDGIVERLRPGGLLCLDNVLWGGRVVDPQAMDADTLGIRAANERVVADPRVESVMLPVSDGLTLIRKRSAQ
jgi:caffeoyl-CoA O-methyltransferase